MSVIKYISKPPIQSICKLIRNKSPQQYGKLRFSTTISTCNRVADEDEALQENPFYSKYEDKIKKMKESGLYEPPKNQHNNKLLQEAHEWKKNMQLMEKKLNEKKQKEDKIAGLKLPTKLDALMRTDLLADVSPEDITQLWTKYWSERETVSAVMASDVFDSMSSRMKEYPLFLYPLPREQGYEFFMSQFADEHCFFTSLLNYQVNGEDAPWQLCFKLYPELKESKGLVLLACEFDNGALSILEAQFLAQLQQLYYASPTDARVKLLRDFNHFPDSFKYMDVVKEIEEGGIVVKSS